MIWVTKPPLIRRRISRSVGCREDDQCPTGFFCEVAQLSCRECLSCKELNRQPLRQNETSCITSVTACGACLTGLVPGQADNKCVSPDGHQLLLPYEWAVIAICLLLAVVICAAAVYVLRNFDTFKIFASTRTSVHPPVDVEASAPQLPPSYNELTALPPANQFRNDDERAPFIKQIPSPQTRDACETAGRQAARVFNNPSYVRPVQPPSYESPNILQETLPTNLETATDINSNDDSTNSASMRASEIEESNANEAQIARSLTATQLHAKQDTNNNSDGEDARDISFSRSGTAFIINVIKNVNTVQQRNELTL